MQVGSVPAAPGSNETGGKQRTLLGSPGYAPGHSRSGRTSLARPRAPHRASRAMRVEGCSRAPNTAAVTEPHEFTFGAALFIKYRKQSRKHPTGATAARLRWVPGARRAQPGPTHEQPLHPAARSRGAESVGHGQPRAQRHLMPAACRPGGPRERAPHRTAPRTANRSAPHAGCLCCLGPLPASHRPHTPREARWPWGPVAAGGSPFRVHGLDGSRRKRAGTGNPERTRNGHVSAVQRRSRARSGAGPMCGGTPGTLGPVPSFPLAWHRC